MFGIGMPEMFLILAVALIVIGPKKLPDLAKSLGRALGEFKKATSELKESIQLDTDIGDVKNAFKDMGTDIKEAVDKVPDTSDTAPDEPTMTSTADVPEKTAEPETPGDSALTKMQNAFNDVDMESFKRVERDDDARQDDADEDDQTDTTPRKNSEEP
ncbi:MAG: twin-arginine translocase TatA/TatE family subunit [Desulfobacteraceae bacterium]|nr:twin-arginine translocase TatA/TatE family subunit [Desulfobacteraceae bacterium]